MVNWRCVVQCVILTSSLAPAHAPDLDLSTVGFEVIRVRHTLSIRVPGDTKIIGVGKSIVGSNTGSFPE